MPEKHKHMAEWSHENNSEFENLIYQKEKYKETQAKVKIELKNPKLN